ncbi:hypothetical protein QFC21_006096 [Naganishia friedmannii]|uniref:Uncharacterized protein n=1 Tax=Naganishia friedmannii TaxID=89922 RepID=A0ACC2V4H9_9TREE|nr:hypothetical protein QFC21_006096 [Naganishia friedmannii]
MIKSSESKSASLKHKIVVCRDLGKEAMSLLYSSDHEIVAWEKDSPPPRKWVLENVQGASGICVMMVDKVDESLLDAAGPSLKVVSTFSVGYDHFDMAAVRARNIRVGYTPNVLNDAVADIAVLLVLMTMRRIGEAIQIVQEGRWPETPWSPFLLTGPALTKPSLTIGFLGFGRISHCTLERLLAFTQPRKSAHAPRCIYTSSRVRSNQQEIDNEYTEQFGIATRRVEVDVLARESDILIILCSLNKDTKGMVNEAFLEKMKSDAVLINVARGPIVDSTALATALENGHLCGAGLDVIDGEPNIPRDHPLVLNPRCVVLPHVGSASDMSRTGMAKLCKQQVYA